MHILAPLALLLLLSGGLYKTKEVWNRDLFKKMIAAWEDTRQFQKAVDQGKIPAGAAEFAFRAKWEGGATQAQVQGYIDKWVDYGKLLKQQSKRSAAQAQSN